MAWKWQSWFRAEPHPQHQAGELQRPGVTWRHPWYGGLCRLGWPLGAASVSPTGGLPGRGPAPSVVSTETGVRGA